MIFSIIAMRASNLTLYIKPLIILNDCKVAANDKLRYQISVCK